MESDSATNQAVSVQDLRSVVSFSDSTSRITCRLSVFLTEKSSFASLPFAEKQNYEQNLYMAQFVFGKHKLGNPNFISNSYVLSHLSSSTSTN